MTQVEIEKQKTGTDSTVDTHTEEDEFPNEEKKICHVLRHDPRGMAFCGEYGVWGMLEDRDSLAEKCPACGRPRCEECRAKIRWGI